MTVRLPVIDQRVAPVRDYSTEIKLNNFADEQIINKFGENDDIDTGTAPEDIWDVGGIYQYSTTADITQLSCSDASFTGMVSISGLDENWDLVPFMMVQCNGQNPVTLPTPLIRCFRMQNVSNQETALDTDKIYVTVGGAPLTGGVPDNDSDIRACIRNGNNQTLMAIFSTPRNTKSVIKGYHAWITRTITAVARMSILTREFGGVFQVKSRFSLNSSANASVSREYIWGGISVGGKADVVMRCETSSANSIGIAGEFDVYSRNV